MWCVCVRDKKYTVTAQLRYKKDTGVIELFVSMFSSLETVIDELRDKIQDSC